MKASNGQIWEVLTEIKVDIGNLHGKFDGMKEKIEDVPDMKTGITKNSNDIKWVSIIGSFLISSVIAGLGILFGKR